jgi:alpha-beta hydrolase superfamily lysophospholipase
MSEEAQEQPTKPVKTRYFTRARVMRRLLLLFAMYVGLCGAIAWFSVAPHRGGVAARPAISGLKFEDIAFHSSDGTKLSGWFIPAAVKPKGVVVLCHGVDGNRMGTFEPAMMLHKHGYATFIFDFRARGNSEGGHSTLGWKETDDLLAAVQVVKNRADMRGVPVGVMGHSMGGAVALMAAAQSSDIRAVIAESAFAQLDHAVHNHFRSIFGWPAPLFEYPSRWLGEQLIGRSSTDIAPVKVISTIAPRAVFLIQDADDTLCPPSESKDLFEACGKPKLLWTVPHAGHIQAIELQPEEYERRIVGFFDSNLR